MGRLAWLVGLGIWAISRVAGAQPVAAPNSEPPPTVAPEQQDIRVGDVILAPAVDPSPNEEREAEGEEEAWRPGNPVVRRKAAPEKRRWYGLPTLAMDAGSAGMIAVGAIDPKSDAGILIGIGGLTYMAGGPIVHLANGHWWRAGGSLLLRTGAPITGALLLGQGCIYEGDCAENIVIGLALGGVLASALDLSLMHSEALEPEPKSSGSWAPQLAFDRRSLLLGASGSF